MNAFSAPLKRKLWKRIAQILLFEHPRLRRQLRRATRRGESTEPILAEANAIGQELAQQVQFLQAIRRGERLLRQSGW